MADNLPTPSNEEGHPNSSRDESVGRQIERWLDLQAEELAIRKDETAIRREEIQANYDYAEKALEAQAADLGNQRTAERKKRRDTFLFLGGLVLIACVFFGWLVASGQDAFALEILKAGVFIATGGTGGYYAGRYRHLSGGDDDG